MGKGDPFAAAQLLDNDPFSADAPAIMENLLREGAPWPFGRTRGDYNPTQFADVFDLAYRLARFHEHAGEWDKLQALALRVARGSDPFVAKRPNTLHESNDFEEYGNALLALALKSPATDPQRAALEQAIEGSTWAPAAAQLTRTRLAAFGEPRQEAFGWRGCSENVTLLASNEAVLSLVRDDRYIYTGHPWGIAVYTLDASPVTRIALGEAAMHLAQTKGALWVGSSDGLFRIDTADFSVRFHPCDDGLTDIDRRFKVRDRLYLRVDALWAEGEIVRFSVRNVVRQIDARTMAMKIDAVRPPAYQAPPPFPAPVAKAIADKRGDGWKWLQLPDGGYVVGSRDPRLPRYEYRNEDWPYNDHVYEALASTGGLYHVTADGIARHISDFGRDSMPGTNAFFALHEESAKRIWVGSEYGLSLFDENWRLVRTLTRLDGLCANRVTSGAIADGRLYFGTGRDDHGGGLAIIDPRTTLITSLFRADGMAGDKIRSIEPGDGGRLILSFEPEYMRSSSAGYKWPVPQGFDPATEQFESPRPPRTMGGVPYDELHPKTMDKAPFLGGHVLARTQIAGRQVILSTRGIIAYDGPEEPTLAFTPLAPSVQGRTSLRAKSPKRARSLKCRSGASNEWNRPSPPTTPTWLPRSVSSFPLASRSAPRSCPPLRN